MKIEQAIEILKRELEPVHPLFAEVQEALDMAIEALQQGCEKVAEGCDDYITVKRQFVLDAIDIGLSGYISDDDKLTLEGMGIVASEIPSAQPERKKGEWIIDKDCEGKSRTVTCNLCGYNEFNWHNPNFCPNCGADMIGEEK